MRHDQAPARGRELAERGGQEVTLRLILSRTISTPNRSRAVTSPR